MDILLGAALSLHLAKGGDEYNYVHPHLRLEHNSFIAGYYLNSKELGSLYFGREFFITEDFSIEAGGVTGYKDDDLMKVTPFARAKYRNAYATPHIIDGKIKGIVIGYEWLLDFN